jgi:hypothetical protein
LAVQCRTLSRAIGFALAFTFCAAALPPGTRAADASSPSPALDAHLAAAVKLQRIAMPREMTLTVINAIFDVVGKRLAAGAAPASAGKIEELMRQLMAPATDGFNSIVAAHFAARFSDAQLREYTAFFTQPIYGRSLSEMPAVVGELTPWFLDRDRDDVDPAFERARTEVAEGVVPALPATLAAAPPPDAHTGLAIAVFRHGQTDRAPIEEMLWRSQARKLTDVDDATKRKVHDAFVAEIAPHVPAYRLQIAEIYGRHFSDDDLRQLDAFFSSPTYTTFMTQQDQIMLEVRPEFMAWMKTNVLPNLVDSVRQMKDEGTSP